MKQKIVIEVEVHCSKCRSEALQLAASATGVMQVALEGESKNRIVVMGEGVDAVSLVQAIRKEVNYASLESVEEVKEKDVEEEEPDENEENEEKNNRNCDDNPPHQWELVGVVADRSPHESCNIM